MSAVRYYKISENRTRRHFRQLILIYLSYIDLAKRTSRKHYIIYHWRS